MPVSGAGGMKAEIAKGKDGKAVVGKP